MGIFDNIVLDEFTMLDEGKQAEEYKERKEIEKEDRAWDDYRKSQNRKDKKDPYGSHDAYRAEKHAYGKADEEYKKKYGRDYMSDQLSNDVKLRDKKKRNNDYGDMVVDQKRNQKSSTYKSYMNDDKIKDFVEKDKKENPDKRGDPSNTTRRNNAIDAYDRHMRKQAKKKSAKTESALMLIAGYDSEFAY